MSEAYRALEARFARMSHIGGALSVLQWDHQVMMPPGGSRCAPSRWRRSARSRMSC